MIETITKIIIILLIITIIFQFGILAGEKIYSMKYFSEWKLDAECDKRILKNTWIHENWLTQACELLCRGRADVLNCREACKYGRIVE